MVSSSDDDENNSNANEKSYSVDYEVSPEVEATRKPTPPTNPNLPKVLVAGGGIAGLITAAACKRKGMEVVVFEKVTKYKPFGGPIQLQCNSQGALDSIDPRMAEEVFARGIITGDRVNGLLDGISGEWFYRFDTRQPCYMNGLPLTLVLSRYDLLDILREGVGDENIMMGTIVDEYEHTNDGKVIAKLTDGTTHEGDVLIGCDGIRSKIRESMPGIGRSGAKYGGIRILFGVTGDATPETASARREGERGEAHQWFGDGCYTLVFTGGGEGRKRDNVAVCVADDGGVTKRRDENAGWLKMGSVDDVDDDADAAAADERGRSNRASNAIAREEVIATMGRYGMPREAIDVAASCERFSTSACTTTTRYRRGATPPEASSSRATRATRCRRS